MPRRCSVCEHPQVEAINVALVNGDALRDVAGRYGLSKTALHRHKAHLPARLVKAREAEGAARADSLLQQVRDLHARTLTILAEAEAERDHATALKAIREARGNLELLAKLLGELQEKRVTNILVAPEWLSLRAVILEALEPYPQARLALVAALEEVGAGGPTCPRPATSP